MKKNYLFWVAFCVTVFLHGQGFESFINFPPTGGSYETGTFLGQDDSTWAYTQCRGDISISEKSIMLGRSRTPQSEFFSGSINNGIGQISFNFMQAFSTNVNLNILINNVVVGNVTSSSELNVVKNSGVININQLGPITIKFKNVDTSDGQVVVDNITWSAFGTTLSIVKNQIEGFALYPNPISNGKLFMSSNSNVNKQLEIYSMMGKRVYSQNVNGHETIDISKLNSGIYMIRVEEEDKIATRKLIIK